MIFTRASKHNLPVLSGWLGILTLLFLLFALPVGVFSQTPAASVETGTSPLLDFLRLTPVTAVLIVVLFTGLFMEMKSPGLVFPIGAALAAAILLFLPHYLNGTAEVWEIALFAAGATLLAFEIFVIPGFGIAGILGITAMVAALVSSLVRNHGLDYTGVELSLLLNMAVMVVFGLIFGLVAVFYLLKRLVTSSRKHPLVLSNQQEKAAGYTAHDPTLDALIGQEGTALTDLRPVGAVEVEGRRLECVSGSGWVKRGSRVRVRGLDATTLVVEPAEE